MMNITRLGGDKSGPGKSGPEQYAPPDRRPLEKLRDDDQAVDAFESELREFVRRDVSLSQQGDVDPANRSPENLNTLIQRIAGASIAEIDRVIFELEGAPTWPGDSASSSWLRSRWSPGMSIRCGAWWYPAW